MVVYLDLVILSTVIVNTLIIMGIECIFNEKVNILRIIVSNILSVLFLALYIIPLGKFIFIRYFVGILIGYISFNKCRIKNKVIKICFYYLFNISLVGLLEIFNIRNMYLLILGVLFIISLGIVTSFRNKDELLVKINNKNLNALYDSGNYTFYNGVPVVYLSKKYLSDIYIYQGEVSINTVYSKCNISIYSGPSLSINNKEYRVYYSFGDISDFDMILHAELGGVRCLSY